MSLPENPKFQLIIKGSGFLRMYLENATEAEAQDFAGLLARNSYLNQTSFKGNELEFRLNHSVSRKCWGIDLYQGGEMIQEADKEQHKKLNTLSREVNRTDVRRAIEVLQYQQLQEAGKDIKSFIGAHYEDFKPVAEEVIVQVGHLSARHAEALASQMRSAASDAGAPGYVVRQADIPERGGAVIRVVGGDNIDLLIEKKFLPQNVRETAVTMQDLDDSKLAAAAEQAAKRPKVDPAQTDMRKGPAKGDDEYKTLG